MARLNRVFLSGIIKGKRINEPDEDAVFLTLLCPVRQSHNNLLHEDHKLQEVLVYSEDKEIIRVLKTIPNNRRIEVCGLLVVRAVPNTVECKNCGSLITFNKYIHLIHPLSVSTYNTELRVQTDNAIESELESRRDFFLSVNEKGNLVELIGDVHIEPYSLINDTKEPNANNELKNIELSEEDLAIREEMEKVNVFPLRTRRPFILKEDMSGIYDMPLIKMAGVEEEIHKDDKLFIQGAINKIDVMEKHVCEACGREYKYKTTRTSVFPYTIEFLNRNEERAKLEYLLKSIDPTNDFYVLVDRGDKRHFKNYNELKSTHKELLNKKVTKFYNAKGNIVFSLLEELENE